jgi:small subunit ribosomal protein S9
MADEKRDSEQGEVEEPAGAQADEAASAEPEAQAEESAPEETPAEPVAEESSGEEAPESAAEEAPAEPVAEESSGEEAPEESAAEEAPAEPVAEESSGEEAPAEPVAEEAAAEEAAPAEAPAAEGEADEEEVESTPRVKPEIPGADLEVDIVREGEDALRGEYGEYEDGEEGEAPTETAEGDEELPQPITAAAIDLAAGARYRATGKRKTAIARVILKPGAGAYAINGRTLEQHFPRHTLQRQIRQALETVGLEEKMDVVAKMHGGGVSAQADALRHGISRALVEADPNLRSELKRRGFLTRDARVKERKKAGLKKARKRPQFSKR